jgi:hypothetical protein
MYIVSMTKKTNQLMLTSRVLAWRASWLEVGITGHTLVQIGPVASEELIKM